MGRESVDAAEGGDVTAGVLPLLVADGVPFSGSVIAQDGGDPSELRCGAGGDVAGSAGSAAGCLRSRDLVRVLGGEGLGREDPRTPDIGTG